MLRSPHRNRLLRSQSPNDLLGLCLSCREVIQPDRINAENSILFYQLIAVGETRA